MNEMMHLLFEILFFKAITVTAINSSSKLLWLRNYLSTFIVYQSMYILEACKTSYCDAMSNALCNTFLKLMLLSVYM